MLNYFESIDFGEKFVGIVSELLVNKNFIDWVLIKSQNFCFDQYTFKKIDESKIFLSEKAREFQDKKINKYINDCLIYNENYKGIGEFVMYSGNFKVFRKFEPLDFGKFKDKVIFDLAEISPYYLEFCINNFPSFILENQVLDEIEKINPSYIILKKTRDTLDMKYSLLKTYKFLVPRFEAHNITVLNQMRKYGL